MTISKKYKIGQVYSFIDHNKTIYRVTGIDMPAQKIDIQIIETNDMYWKGITSPKFDIDSPMYRGSTLLRAYNSTLWKAMND